MNRSMGFPTGRAGRIFNRNEHAGDLSDLLWLQVREQRVLLHGGGGVRGTNRVKS